MVSFPRPQTTVWRWHTVSEHFIPLEDCVMLLKLCTTYRIMNIIQAYAPTKDTRDEKVEEFYATLEAALKLTKEGEITIALGDVNAKIGLGAEGGVPG
ncbi:hypothetical protein HUJ05_001776 [Dendroctonus ponderosae]|nr:hypothetical protein HUJ05_001776 [Dendroctonus ponderosae]